LIAYHLLSKVPSSIIACLSSIIDYVTSLTERASYIIACFTDDNVYYPIVNARLSAVIARVSL